MKYRMNQRLTLMEEKPDGGRQMYIEFLKGISILTIVLFHLDYDYVHGAPAVWSKLIEQFFYATRIFIFCSGFGLYYSYLRHPMPYPTFLKKRLTRVYVPYILIVFVCFFVPYTYQENDRISALLSHVFLYKMFSPRYIQSFGPFWFVSSIIQYYLLFYLIVRMKEKLKNDRLFLGIWVFLGLVWWTLNQCIGLRDKIDFVYDACVLHQGWIFALGMLAAERLRRNHSITIRVWQLILGFVLLFPVYAVLNHFLYDMNEIPRSLLILCGFTILWCCSGKIFRKFGCRLGSISYEWYLTHLLILQGLFLAVQPEGFPRQAALGAAGLVITVFAAWLYHLGVSKLFFPKRAR